MVEFNTGKNASERGPWYLSCEDAEGSLVGIYEAGEWTCPVLGLERHAVTEEQIIELMYVSMMIVGNNDGDGIQVCNKRAWNKIMNQELGEEWGNELDTVLFVTTDTEYVIRLHMSFE